MSGDLTTYDLRDVERALCEGDDTAELGIRLTLDGDRLFVRGDVASDERRQHVLDVVARHCPDVPIVDELAVAADGLAQAPAHREEIA